MKNNKWISRLADVNKELLLILTIIAAAGVVNFFVAGQRLVLSFYNLPTLLAAYYFRTAPGRGGRCGLGSIRGVDELDEPGGALTNGSTQATQRLLTWSDFFHFGPGFC